jgi:hypothetical protein
MRMSDCEIYVRVQTVRPVDEAAAESFVRAVQNLVGAHVEGGDFGAYIEARNIRKGRYIAKEIMTPPKR